MPTSVCELFQMVGRVCYGRVSWGQSINCNTPGVYVVALSSEFDKLICIDKAPISNVAVSQWLTDVPALTLDLQNPTCDALYHRLQRFWLPDETILYIGKAGTSLRARVNQLYMHVLGNPRPHKGGHWIKVLKNLSELSIYWTTFTDVPAHVVELSCMSVFINNTSLNTRERLFDPVHPFPYANLEFPNGTKKEHGLQHQVNR